MTFQAILLLLVTIGAAYASLKTDLTICPNQEAGKSLVGNTTVDYPGRLLTIQVKTKRFPTIGMYNNDITCIEAIDITGNQNSGAIELIEGGLQQRFAVIRFRSHIGGAIRYIVQTYTSI